MAKTFTNIAAQGDFIKDLEEWLTDQNTEAPQGGSAVDASDPQPSGPTDSSGVQSAG